jgi:cell division protein FtsQ
MAEPSFEQGPQRQGREERNPKRLLLIVISLLGVVLVGELVYHFLVSPWLRIDRVVVDSELAMSDQELLEITGLADNPHYSAVDTALIGQRLREVPVVASVQVSKRFPNELSISVQKREPLAIAFAEEGTLPVVFDAEGVVFRWKEAARSLDLPVVSGIRFEDPNLGMRLPQHLGAFLSDLEQLKNDAPGLFRQFSEFRIVPTGSRDFEVVLYPQSYGVPVRIEPHLDRQSASYIVMVLDAFRRDGSLDTIRELDFRAGEVVYRTREEQ